MRLNHVTLRVGDLERSVSFYKLLGFTQIYGQLSPIIPFIFTAPFYFAGTIALGVMTQTAGAFARVEGLRKLVLRYMD